MEMQDKFGLEFRIVDADLLRELRRARDPYVNPWTHFPRLITSVDWLKRERPMRLLRDVLPVGPPTLPRAFDLLIVDEVHGCAPAGRGRYATDSLRTTAVLFGRGTSSFSPILGTSEPWAFLRGRSSHNGWVVRFPTGPREAW